MKQPVYSIRLIGESLGFCATHFITFFPSCHRQNAFEALEPLHGHNFRVRAKIFGPLNDAEYLIDFLAASSILREILERFHHKILIAKEHPKFHFSTDCDDIEILSLADSRRWIFPAQDVLFLECKNATTEAIARIIAEEFVQRMAEAELFFGGPEKYAVSLALEEDRGMLAEIKLEGENFRSQE